jgi:cell division protein FtsB
MNYLIALLLVLLLVLQYNLWVGKGSIHEVRQLEISISRHKAENRQMAERNDALKAEVMDLKNGLDTIEEKARNELGMIQKGETFFHIIEAKK